LKQIQIKTPTALGINQSKFKNKLKTRNLLIK